MKENKILIGLKIFKRAFGSYRWSIALLIATGFLSGLMEGIGINTVIPLFSFVVKDQQKPMDPISMGIEAVFNFLHIPYNLTFLLVLIATLFVIKALMTFLTNYITERIRTGYVKSARSKLFDMTLEANWMYLSEQKIGHLEKVIMTDIMAYSAVLSYVSSTFILLTNVLIYVLIAANVSPQITLFTIALGGLFFICFKPVMDKVRIISHEASVAQKHVANHINESMLGVKTVKSMAIEQEVIKKGVDFFERLRKNEMRLSIFSSLTYVITQPVSIFVILGMFAYFYKLTTFSFASFVVIVYSINKIFTYVQDGQSRLQNIAGLYPYLRTVATFEDNAVKSKEPYQGKDAFNFQDAIQFKDVSFAYGDRPVLSHIDITIKKGQMIGIVGPSGSGKTTLVDLLLSLIRPQTGDILVDRKPLSEINAKKWKRHIGYVSQDIFIVNDSIRNNIKLYDPSISDAEMIEAAKKAHLYDFVMSLPNGFDSPAGERGMGLSGGQRQRLALARVFARQADILVLDEATSALDNESEAIIQKAIEEFRGTITMIIIAHRPTTVASVDELIVLEDGMIREKGDPKKLAQDTDSYFHKIFNAKH